MKTIKNTALLILLSVGFAYAQDIQVQGEKKANADFKKYKTFGWIQEDRQSNNNQVVEYTYEEVVPMTSSDKKISPSDKKKAVNNNDNKEVVIYSYSYLLPSSDAEINKTVTKSVDGELEGRGYRKENLNPDMLVAYKVFDRSSKVKAFTTTEPTKLAGGSEVREPKDTLTYALKPGSIMITFMDSKTSDIIWEGSASGVTKDNGVTTDRMKIKEAINLIFKQFEYRGDKNVSGQ